MSQPYVVDMMGSAIWLGDVVAVYDYLDGDGYSNVHLLHRGTAGPIKEVVVCGLEINRGIPGQLDWIVDGYGERHPAAQCLLILGKHCNVPMFGWRGEII